jgi:quercetin dioxygenase-like cupin family protein
MTQSPHVTPDGSWYPNPDGAGEFRLLRAHDEGGATVMVRVRAGTSGKPHVHPAGEELLVTIGEVIVAGTTLSAGDYLYTPPNAQHAATAVTDCEFLLVLPALPQYALENVA